MAWPAKQMNSKGLLGLALAAVLLLAGCQQSANFSAPVYQYRWESRTNVVELRATFKSEDVVNVGMNEAGYGIIDWMVEEGSVVASGDVLVKINMDDSLQTLRSREKSLAEQSAQQDNLSISGPAEIAQLQKLLREKELELQLAEKEEIWLKQKKTRDEVWKIYADLQIASISYEHARNIYGLQKNVTDKGFDSPFALRSSEIDMRSREIELDYAGRIRKQLSSEPLAEDLARLEYQKAVASGEIWLVQNQLQAASITGQLRNKNFEMVIERIKSRIREINRSLKDRVLTAPRAGLIIHPFLWGDFKFKPGSHAWQGATIVQVIGSDKFYLESMAAEADANMIVEKASATIEFDSLPGRIFAGEVKSISKSPRANRGQSASQMRFFPVLIACEIAEKILPGSKARVSIIMGERSGVFIPRETLIKKDEKFFVKLKTSFGQATNSVEIEDFNPDWVLWKNAPASQGIILYP